jgi:hypothetical protein
MTTTLNLIAKQTVGSGGAASVTFSSIPQTYTDLKLVVSIRGTRSATTEGLLLSFNGSGSSFSTRLLGGSGSSTFSSTYTRGYTGDVDAANATANTFGSGDIYIPNYTSANYKSFSTDVVQEDNSSTAYAEMFAGLWSNTAAITSLTIATDTGGQTWAEFSTFYLYGISSSSTQNTSVPLASGGDVITTDGTYWYHTFLYSGTFTPTKNLNCDYLVIAGGGSGGGNKWGRGSGGGGAGGFRTSIGGTPLSLTPQIYVATVGAGGATNNNLPYGSGASTTTDPGGKGGNSIFASITTTGGGGGGSGGLGSIGGSGGGNGEFQNNAGIAGNEGGYSPVEGYASGSVSNSYGASGGGGAGGVGVNRTSNASTAGGPGRASTITGGSVTYAGGGGGGADFDGGGGGQGAGAGGTGGGGAGATTSNAGAGAVNTGSGGGGGAGNGGTGGQSGAGGSGIIIVRYAV